MPKYHKDIPKKSKKSEKKLKKGVYKPLKVWYNGTHTK